MKPRISVMTFNIWGNEHLTERSLNLCNVLSTLYPDLLMLQEVTAENLQFVQKSLPTHQHLENFLQESSDGEGKLFENTIFWNHSIFDFVQSGFISFHHPDYSQRGLHWVRLAFHENIDDQFIIATTHLPWVGSHEEISSGVNQRIQCSKLVLSFLNSIRKPGEPVIFGGDLNDDFHPLRILRGDNQQDSSSNLSLRDVFEILDLPPQITHPVRPSDAREEMRPSRTIDYILISADSKILSGQGTLPSCAASFQPIAAFVKGIRGNWPPPSDHLPVISVLEWRGETS